MWSPSFEGWKDGCAFWGDTLGDRHRKPRQFGAKELCDVEVGRKISIVQTTEINEQWCGA